MRLTTTGGCCFFVVSVAVSSGTAAPAAAHAEGITLVEQGQPQAVVVTADEPSRMAAYAAG